MGSATLIELMNEVVRFRDEREWKQFHDPKEMAISLALEAAEDVTRVGRLSFRRRVDGIHGTRPRVECIGS